MFEKNPDLKKYFINYLKESHFKDLDQDQFEQMITKILINNPNFEIFRNKDLKNKFFE